MISLYTDEDVDVLLKQLLHAKGFTVITAHNAGMLGKDDREQLEYTIRLKCTFMTHNRVHFENLFTKFLKEGKEHYGIIIATRRNVYELARCLASFLKRHTEEEIKNQLWYL